MVFYSLFYFEIKIKLYNCLLPFPPFSPYYVPPYCFSDSRPLLKSTMITYDSKTHIIKYINKNSVYLKLV